MPIVIAIIGGATAQFAPLADLYRRACEEAGHPGLPVAVHSPGHVAETDEQAAQEYLPYFVEQMRKLGAELAHLLDEVREVLLCRLLVRLGDVAGGVDRDRKARVTGLLAGATVEVGERRELRRRPTDDRDDDRHAVAGRADDRRCLLYTSPSPRDS